jgi:putative endonuclease
MTYVYILASKRNGTLYIGSTVDLNRRIREHKAKLIPGFTKKYNVTILVVIEEYVNLDDALIQERQLKKWKRKWKLNLIEAQNPNWVDLAADWDY